MRRNGDPEMILTRDGFDGDAVVSDGNKFLTGNGKFGYRGTLDEMTREHCVGLNIAGLYDGVEGKWRETVNAFNPFYLQVYADGKPLCAWSDNVIGHRHSLDISCGVFSRETRFSVCGGTLELKAQRFCSMADVNVLASRLTVSSDVDVVVEIVAGIDNEVWELNGPHFSSVAKGCREDMLYAVGSAQESGTSVRVNCKFSSAPNRFDGRFARFYVTVAAGNTYVLDRIAQVLVGDEQPTPTEDYDALYARNADMWSKMWDRSDVELEGDGIDRAQFALRYSIYQLLILTPRGDCSIAARGLSGQTYKGAVFWDTEMFLLPFFMNTDIAAAKRLVEYRIRTLDGAIAKAKSYGYRGAFYAWESQDGYDACSDFNVTDVFTHRPVRTYFKDKQIHISADVALGIIRYFDKTQDNELLLRGGLETLLQISLFYYSYSYYNHNKDRFELLDVMGPDEYHERVNNNAYTNYIAYHCTVRALELCRALRREFPSEVAAVLRRFEPDICDSLDEWASKLYLPACGDNGVMEQFDGYFALEDVTAEEVRKRLVNPREYWGGTTGVATATRVIKQADVVMLTVTLPQYFTVGQIAANYRFYLGYTEHGSSLSASAYALAACMTGRAEDAWKWFLQTAEIDLNGGGKQWAGDVYIGGTHPAASGGAWMVAAQGFEQICRPKFLHRVVSHHE